MSKKSVKPTLFLSFFNTSPRRTQHEKFFVLFFVTYRCLDIKYVHVRVTCIYSIILAIVHANARSLSQVLSLKQAMQIGKETPLCSIPAKQTAFNPISLSENILTKIILYFVSDSCFAIESASGTYRVFFFTGPP